MITLNLAKKKIAPDSPHTTPRNQSRESTKKRHPQFLSKRAANGIRAMVRTAFVPGTAVLTRAHFSHAHLSRHPDRITLSRHAPRRARLTACATASPAERSPAPKPSQLRVTLLAVSTVVFAVCNRVAHRVQLTGAMKVSAARAHLCPVCLMLY